MRSVIIYLALTVGGKIIIDKYIDTKIVELLDKKAAEMEQKIKQ